MKLNNSVNTVVNDTEIVQKLCWYFLSFPKNVEIIPPEPGVIFLTGYVGILKRNICHML